MFVSTINFAQPSPYWEGDSEKCTILLAAPNCYSAVVLTDKCFDDIQSQAKPFALSGKEGLEYSFKVLRGHTAPRILDGYYD